MLVWVLTVRPVEGWSTVRGPAGWPTPPAPPPAPPPHMTTLKPQQNSKQYHLLPAVGGDVRAGAETDGMDRLGWNTELPLHRQHKLPGVPASHQQLCHGQAVCDWKELQYPSFSHPSFSHQQYSTVPLLQSSTVPLLQSSTPPSVINCTVQYPSFSHQLYSTVPPLLSSKGHSLMATILSSPAKIRKN